MGVLAGGRDAAASALPDATPRTSSSSTTAPTTWESSAARWHSGSNPTVWAPRSSNPPPRNRRPAAPRNRRSRAVTSPPRSRDPWRSARSSAGPIPLLEFWQPFASTRRATSTDGPLLERLGVDEAGRTPQAVPYLAALQHMSAPPIDLTGCPRWLRRPRLLRLGTHQRARRLDDRPGDVGSLPPRPGRRVAGRRNALSPACPESGMPDVGPATGCSAAECSAVG